VAKDASKRKRVRLKAGDIFELTVPDGRLGYGVVVMPGVLKGGGTPYIIILQSLHSSQPSLADLAGDEIALVGWTMDALVYHGRWRVVGHDYPARIDVPFPNWKVGRGGVTYVIDVMGEIIDEATAEEQELLDLQWSRAPIGFQNAFEAMHGFRNWDEHYDKLTAAYARKRMTRQPRTITA